MLTACSDSQTGSSLSQILKSEGIEAAKIESPAENSIDGVQPQVYQLDNEEKVTIYDFESSEKHVIGYNHFRDRQQLLSSHAPLVFEVNNFLVLYYNNAISNRQTANIKETKYGEKLQEAVQRLK